MPSISRNHRQSGRFRFLPFIPLYDFCEQIISAGSFDGRTDDMVTECVGRMGFSSGDWAGDPDRGLDGDRDFSQAGVRFPVGVGLCVLHFFVFGSETKNKES